MDNHAHLLVRCGSSEDLGNFMRTVNSQLARKINKFFDRDSQAIRERYKSPMISDQKYLMGTMVYIWLNRFKLTKLRPEHDKFCSLSWRVGSIKIYNIFKNNVDIELMSTLLDSYKDEDLEIEAKSFNSPKHLLRILNDAIKSISTYVSQIYENIHTIADKSQVEVRSSYLSCIKRKKLKLLYDG